MRLNINPFVANIAVNLVHLVMGVLLLLCAYIQLNDPDPYFWALLYTVCALVPLLSLFKHYYQVVGWVGLLLCSVGVGQSMSGMIEYLQHVGEEPLMQPMSDTKVYIEEAREMLGSLFALVVVLTYFIFKKPKRAHTE